MKARTAGARREGREEARKALEAGKPRADLTAYANDGREIAAELYDATNDRNAYELLHHFKGMLDVLETTP